MSVKDEVQDTEQLVEENTYQMYHFGIIDYLQDWSYSKKGERLLKTIKMIN